MSLSPAKFLNVWLLVGLLTGCGNGGDVELHAVSGVVTLNGAPLADAEVIFRPQAGGRLSSARTDADGRFVLEYLEGKAGAVPGVHQVSISTLIEQDRDSSDPLIQKGRKETVPARYNRQSTLTAEVQAGSSPEFRFDLEATQKPQGAPRQASRTSRATGGDPG